MRQHKLALCKDHYLEWILFQTERAIKKYRMFGRDAHILVAVSGGKDSLSLWDVLWQLGYSVDGLYIQLGIEEGYSIKSEQLCANFAENRQLNLQVIDLAKEFGETVIGMSQRSQRSKNKPCSVCGMVKRYLMNKAALSGGYDVVVTGHNLDDEAAVLLGNTIHWSQDLLPRQSPVLEDTEGFVRKAKPFCRLYERETAAYAILMGIDYIHDECPYSLGNSTLFYKEMLNKLEDEKPGSKLNFYQSFLNARDAGFFQMGGMGISPELSTCKNCGQPTNTTYCAFCRLIEQTLVTKESFTR